MKFFPKRQLKYLNLRSLHWKKDFPGLQVIYFVTVQDNKGSVTFMNLHGKEHFFTLNKLHKQCHSEDENLTEDFTALWEQCAAKRNAAPDDIDVILQTVNLKQAKLFNSIGRIKSAQGLFRCGNDIMLSDPVKRYLEQLLPW